VAVLHTYERQPCGRQGSARQLAFVLFQHTPQLFLKPAGVINAQGNQALNRRLSAPCWNFHAHAPRILLSQHRECLTGHAIRGGVGFARSTLERGARTPIADLRVAARVANTVTA
jgi:hypothetical protein